MAVKKILVVGGGPIGLVTAISFAKNHEVILLEKKSWPRDKVCGQGIMPSGAKVLKNIGYNFSAENSSSFLGVEFFIDGILLTGNLPSCGYGVERSVLSENLYNLAKRNSNIELLDRSEFISFVEKNDQCHVKYQRGGELNKLTVDHIIACDGLHSRVRSFLGLEKKRADKFRRGARFHYNLTPWSQYVQSYWKTGIEAYVTPVSNSRIEIAFLWDDRVISRETPLPDYLLSQFPELGKKIKLNEIKDFGAYGPFSAYSKCLRSGKVIFLGDAYKFVDGITGEGLSVGFKCADILSKGINTKNLFRVRLVYLQYELVTKFVLLIARHRFLKHLLRRLIQRNQYILNFLMRLNDHSI